MNGSSEVPRYSCPGAIAYHAVETGEVIGVYAAPHMDDVVFFFECSAVSRDGWSPDGELAEVDFMGGDGLPADLSPRTAARIADALSGARGVVRIFTDGSDTGEVAFSGDPDLRQRVQRREAF